MLKSYYEILNIKENATKAQIKAQYKKLAKMYHPDINSSLEAERIFKDINRAVSVLLDDEKRKEYDALRIKKVNSFNQKPKEKYKKTYKNEEREIKKPIDGKDIFVKIKISYKEAILGTRRTINIAHSEICPKCRGFKFANGSKCPICDGLGEIVTKRKITVTIPDNVKNNSKLRIKNEGDIGRFGGKNGNLYVEINIEEKNELSIKDGIVYYDAQISPYTAVLGGDIKVPTLNGFETINIPPLTKSNQTFKLINVGVFDEKTNKYGDEIVKIIIQIPSDITDVEYNLYQKLKEINLNKKNARTIS